MTTPRSEKSASIEYGNLRLKEYAAMLYDAFEQLAPIQPDAEEVSVGKFCYDDPEDGILQFSLGYEQDKVIGFIGRTTDLGETHDSYYQRTSARDTWESATTGNPVNNTTPLRLMSDAAIDDPRITDDRRELLQLVLQADQQTDRDVFDMANMVLAPISSNVRRLKRYDYSDIMLRGADTSQVDFSIYHIVDNNKKLTRAHMTIDIERDEIPCKLECLFNDGEPYLELRIVGEGIDEPLTPDNLEATLHELMRLLVKLVQEKREPYLETHPKLT